MRRMLSILPILTLVVGATALPGCSSGMRNECPTICQPDCVHEYVVDQKCYCIDEHGNRLVRRVP